MLYISCGFGGSTPPSQSQEHNDVIPGVMLQGRTFNLKSWTPKSPQDLPVASPATASLKEWKGRHARSNHAGRISRMCEARLQRLRGSKQGADLNSCCLQLLAGNPLPCNTPRVDNRQGNGCKGKRGRLGSRVVRS